MSQQWSVQELMSYLPHRPPMVWVDRVLEVGKDYRGLTGRCLIDVDSQALYVNNGVELRASAAIEFTAQAFGYLKAAYQDLHQINNPPEETYLTGVRYCYADFSQLDVTQPLQLEVRLKVKRELLPLTFVYGEIFELGQDERLAQVEIQVYVD